MEGVDGLDEVQAFSESSPTSGDAQPMPPTKWMGCGAQKGHSSALDRDNG
jgi:hypothetical protein